MTQIPQVADIVKVKGGHEITLKKDIRQHFDVDSNQLYLGVGAEALLSTRKTSGARPVALEKNRLRLDDELLSRLELAKGDRVALIQRGDDLALKKLSIDGWRESDAARIIDYETAYHVLRVAYVNRMPEEALPQLTQACSRMKLKRDVRDYLRGRETFWAWRGREAIGMAGKADGRVGEALIQARVEAQEEDGSWENSVVLTAKRLRELGELGVPRDAASARQAAEWLLARPESPHKPGAFFLNDELVPELAFCVEKGRSKPGKKYFRERTKPAEKEAGGAADDLFHHACGPRFLWPNALVLEALVYMGYEDHERVRKSIAAMAGSDWCECHVDYSKPPEPPSEDDMEMKLQSDMMKFRQGGLHSVEELGILALSRKCDFQTRRVSHCRKDGKDVYEIREKNPWSGPCPVVIARALSCVPDKTVQKRIERQLWNIARDCDSPQKSARYFYDSRPLALDALARYENPIAKTGIMKSVPWIIDLQNADGSWGEEPYTDAATFAVLRALTSVKQYLPAGMLP